MTKDREVFARLYEQVRKSCENMGDAATRQSIIIRLYDSFFRIALKKTADKLGIVYTPVEVVDFILRSVDDVLYKNFGRRLTDKNVHVLDPFTGTGTFITRLIQSDLIKPQDRLRKYRRELHANEIVLLAYYIAAVNIENAFHEVANVKSYQPFAGICLTDTFELYESGEQPLNMQGIMKENSERVNEQKNSHIEVIVGNPPYRVGQTSSNDNAQNNRYKDLEDRIGATYAKGTKATSVKSLYDSYIKAFRWASDRIGDAGIIGFITNANWIDKDANSGMRKCFEKEFSEIYVFNLRGDIRNKEKADSAKDGENVFEIMTGVAITILVKNPDHVGKAKIFYCDIGDYLNRKQKFERINSIGSVLSDKFKLITPNDKGDWINQRGNNFDSFTPLAPERKFDGAAQSFFVTCSNCLKTNRDTWCYNFSRSELEKNIQTTIDYYNTHEPTEVDSKKIVWADGLVQNKNRGREMIFDSAQIVESSYRPFCIENLYYDSWLNERVYQMPKLFPTGNEKNLLICVTGANARKNFSVLMTNKITDLEIIEKAQCFPLYWYEEARQGGLFGTELSRRDGVTDFILKRARKLYGASVSKEDIFYYVYGFLHLPSYREKFANELKKSLPRIILVDDAEKFRQLSRAGRELAELHLNYETQDLPEGVKVIGAESGNFRVVKMRLVDGGRTLIYNEHITVANIPVEASVWRVNGRSALEWIVDRYQVKKDAKSGIVNDANAWGIEHDNPRYILDLILSSITVSLKTLDIIGNLPILCF